MNQYKPNPDYLMQGKQPTVVLMTDRELLEILDILKDTVLSSMHYRRAEPLLDKIEKMENKFKTNK